MKRKKESKKGKNKITQEEGESVNLSKRKK